MPFPVVCQSCGETFHVKYRCHAEGTRPRTICSIKCRTERNRQVQRGPRFAKTCAECGKAFHVKQYQDATATYCSNACRKASYRPVTKTCEMCPATFKVKQYRADTARFCSQRCGGRWHMTQRRMVGPLAASDAQKAAMVTAYVGGATQRDSAAAAGLRSNVACANALRVHGVEKRPYYVTPEQEEKMVDAYCRGATLNEASAMCGLDMTACERALQRRGIKRRNRGDYRTSEASLELMAAKVRSYSLDTTYFHAIDTEAKAYWLGFLAADGFVDSKKGTVALSLAEKDADHVARFKADLGYGGPVTVSTQGRGFSRGHKIVRVSISCRKMARALAELGFRENKTWTIEPWQGPPELMRHYWRGVVDGDGCLYRDKRGHWTISLCGNRAMVNGFADFVNNRTQYKATPGPHKMIHGVRVTSRAATANVARLLYGGATVALTRKAERAARLLVEASRLP